MEFDKFIKNEEILLKKFTLYWNENNKKDPKGFPMNMGIGDWLEQLMFFAESSFPEGE